MLSIYSRLDRYLPWIVLIAALAVTYIFWRSEQLEAYQKQQIRFEYRSREVSSLILQKIQVYRQALIGVQSFFEASRSVERSEFHDYVHKFLIAESHSSLRSVGYIKLIDAKHKTMHLKEIRDEIGTQYRIYPEGERDKYAPVVYIEPANQHNLSRIGFDTYTDEVRRDAMYRAQMTDSATVSSRVSFLNEQKKETDPGFLIYLPIYNNNLPHKTFTERSSNLVGWVFIKISADDLIERTLHDNYSDLYLEVFDDDKERQSLSMLGRSKAAMGLGIEPRFSNSQHVRVLDQDWLFRVKSLPEFETQLDTSRANLIGYVGLVTSFLLAFLVMALMAHVRSLRSIREVNNKLILSEQRWKFALEGSGDGVWDWNVQTNEVEFSKQWKTMLGYEDGEIKNQVSEWEKRVHPEDYSKVMADLEAYFKGKTSTYINEHRMLTKQGQWKWILDRGMIVSYTPDQKPLRMVGTHADISKIKESEEVIWQQANFDSLTGLPNRRMFYDRLALEIKKSTRSQLKMALLFLDLDRFKEINDTLGHDQGDALLKEAAQRLSKCLRTTDTVARLGGDEFMIILGDLENTKVAERIAQEILLKLAEPFSLNGQSAYISASIGITLYPDDANKMEDLMKNVDQAMYAAKSAGANRYSYFTPSMQEMAQARMQLANDLRIAITEHQFHLVYQPIINLTDNTIHKAEALLRWRHPIRGYVSPGEFVPIAEDTGLILEIGDFVLEQAVQQVVTWRKMLHPDFQISINKSPVQFYNPSKFHQSWPDYLRSLQLAGNAVIVEITEGLLLEANEHVIRQLEEFRDAGIQVAIDDFGTGYSSLSYIKKFDIDYIKIDKSFVANLSSGSDDLALCEAIIMMAHKLGLKVIAEGVETAVQRDLLVAAGCDYGQGYLFSHALLPADFEQLVLKQL